MLYWGFLAWASAQRPAHIRQGVRPCGWTDGFGAGRHTGTMHRLPLAIMRLRMLRRRSVRFFGT